MLASKLLWLLQRYLPCHFMSLILGHRLTDARVSFVIILLGLRCSVKPHLAIGVSFLEAIFKEVLVNPSKLKVLLSQCPCSHSPNAVSHKDCRCYQARCRRYLRLLSRTRCCISLLITATPL